MTAWYVREAQRAQQANAARNPHDVQLAMVDDWFDDGDRHDLDPLAAARGVLLALVLGLVGWAAIVALAVWILG
jgi:hypothetical protein